MTKQHKFRELGLAVVQTEAQAIAELASRIDERFEQACQLLLACKGRIVVLGMGKSGHIANKIAATLASTGSPAFYVHPGEASHGDLGMITLQDVVLALSYSGETDEIITLLPFLKRLDIPLVALTGNKNSTLAKAANVNIDITISKEACPLGLAPTSSTTATLVMGDALAIALLEAKGFTAEDFALSHPKGSLGRRLLLQVNDIMRTDKSIPRVTPETKLIEALMEMSQKGMGMTTVTDTHNQLLGIFTDGDLRRAIDRRLDIQQTPIKEAMTKNCKTITRGLLAAEALNIMETYKITALIVLDENQKIEGALHMHDLLKAGVA